jgi:hypothetical protein
MSFSIGKMQVRSLISAYIPNGQCFPTCSAQRIWKKMFFFEIVLRESGSGSLVAGPSPAVRAECVLHDHHQKRCLTLAAAKDGAGHP